MKYIFTLTCLFLISSSLLIGQNFKFATFDQPEVISVPVEGVDNSGEKFIYFSVTNTSESPVKLMAYRETNYAQGHSSYFCWDLCYPPFTDSSGAAIELMPGDTTNFAQYLTFKTGNTAGYSEVTMTIQDSVSLEQISYTFQISVGGVLSAEDKLLSKESLSNPFPNPAKDEAFVKIDLPTGILQGTLQMYNLIGKRVLDMPVSSRIGTIRLPIQNLHSGMYFLYLVGDGKEISSRKLVITK